MGVFEKVQIHFLQVLRQLRVQLDLLKAILPEKEGLKYATSTV